MNPYIEYFGLPTDESLLLLNIGRVERTFIEEAEQRVSCVSIDDQQETIQYYHDVIGHEVVAYKMPPFTKELGFVSEWFDFVAAINTVPSYSALRFLSVEIRRVLKPSGKWMVAVDQSIIPHDNAEYALYGCGLIIERQIGIENSHCFIGRSR